MQQARSSLESIQDIAANAASEPPIIVRTGFSSSANGGAPVQRNNSDRLESSEREAALFKGQVSQAFVIPASESELHRTYTAKKSVVSSPNSARLTSSSRTPLIANVRKLANEETPLVPSNDGPFSRSLPQVPVTRSKSFQNGQSILVGTAPANSSDEVTLLRSYRAHLEQVLRKDAPPYSDLKVPSYASIEEVIKANEQLLVENDRLRSELNRLKTESILLLRSMRTTAGLEPNLGNERIMAERERQELAAELARQVEENKRLRKSLLIQSDKFVKLRQSTSLAEAPPSASSSDHRLTPVSVPQSLLNLNKTQPTMKTTRFLLGNIGIPPPRTFNHGSHDPL